MIGGVPSRKPLSLMVKTMVCLSIFPTKPIHWEKAGKSVGKYMGKPWENYGKSVGKWWDHDGQWCRMEKRETRHETHVFSPPARWGLLDFMSVCRSSSSSPPSPPCLLPDLNHDHPRPVFASHAQCSLPDLNHDQPRPVFAAGPQPRPATPSVRCRTSTRTINAQCSLPDLNSYAKSYAR